MVLECPNERNILCMIWLERRRNFNDTQNKSFILASSTLALSITNRVLTWWWLMGTKWVARHLYLIAHGASSQLLTLSLSICKIVASVYCLLQQAPVSGWINKIFDCKQKSPSQLCLNLIKSSKDLHHWTIKSRN